MSDYSSDSRRLQALESNVTEIQGQMSELMGMVRQLTQTRAAGAGQHEEESGGTGRGAAHNPSSGAGRVPPIAVTGYGVTARSWKNERHCSGRSYNSQRVHRPQQSCVRTS